jgi:hypothetical protein
VLSRLEFKTEFFNSLFTFDIASAENHRSDFYFETFLFLFRSSRTGTFEFNSTASCSRSPHRRAEGARLAQAICGWTRWLGRSQWTWVGQLPCSCSWFDQPGAHLDKSTKRSQNSPPRKRHRPRRVSDRRMTASPGTHHIRPRPLWDRTASKVCGSTPGVGTTAPSRHLCNHHVDDRRLAASVGFAAEENQRQITFSFTESLPQRSFQ